MTATPYAQIQTRFGRLGALGEAQSILHWDNATQMPDGGADARAEQMAVMELIQHEMLTDAAVPDLLDAASAQNDLDDWQRANLREMRRSWLHATAVPADLVEASSKASSACEMAWRNARPANDYAGLLPAFKEVLRLTREIAVAKAERLGKTPYDALLDQYEPDGSSEVIDRIFGTLAQSLPGLIDAALSRQAQRPAPLATEGPFPVETQRVVAVKLMEQIGFDFDHGRLDISHHPFSGGTPDDVRITTRYDEDDFRRGMMGVLHETGHALYERGLPALWRRQPVGHARGMSLHESQSLLLEMQVCRSLAFHEFAAPILRDTFGRSGPAWDAENLYRLNTQVARSLIRVDADEVTYPAHVILRYRLERSLLTGDLTLEDLPAAWNDGMRDLVGIVPPDNRQGCLQDIHWFDGAFGYFPTYTLGAMTAAQLFDAAQRTDASIAPGIAKGDFAPLFAWLRVNVHGKASRFSTTEIIEQATGKPLDPAIFERHLRARYIEA